MKNLTSEERIESLEKQVDAIFEVLAIHGIRLDKIEPQIFSKQFCERMDK